MHTTGSSPRTRPGARTAPVTGPAQVEIVIPVRDEERDLGSAVRRLRAYLDDSFPFAARITIADNGSTDGTWAQALELAAEFPLVRAARIERPGRGGALRTIWSGSDADVYAYMDVDLSTDVNALLPLVAPLLSGHSHGRGGRQRPPRTHPSRPEPRPRSLTHEPAARRRLTSSPPSPWPKGTRPGRRPLPCRRCGAATAG
jgi:cellulose synthase/poly-beta-1,6-N-acetylglucosamine synthase-like glycosyltransferase